VDLRRDFREVVRYEVDPPFLATGARGAAEEEGNMPDMLRGGRVDVSVFAHRKNLRHLHVVKVAAPIGQCRQQRGRLADPGRHDDEITVARSEAMVRISQRATHQMQEIKTMSRQNSCCGRASACINVIVGAGCESI
ncbi:MAG: hypothetical protein ABI433_09295, partial [Burkholderiaceae bacterium]